MKKIMIWIFEQWYRHLIWYSTMQFKWYSYIRVLYMSGEHYSIHISYLSFFSTCLSSCRKRHSFSAETDPAVKRCEWWSLRFPAIDKINVNWTLTRYLGNIFTLIINILKRTAIHTCFLYYTLNTAKSFK